MNSWYYLVTIHIGLLSEAVMVHIYQHYITQQQQSHLQHCIGNHKYSTTVEMIHVAMPT